MTEIGLPRTTAPFASVTSTDFTYTGQRDITGTGLMDYKARFYSPTLGRFTQPDSIIPSATNPQSWNRYSYVHNNPILYNDPTGHKPKGDDDPPPLVSYTKEHGLCVKYIGCSGGESYNRWWKTHWAPKLKNDLKDALGVSSKTTDVISFGVDTKDYWTSTHTSPKLGFGLDAAKQLLEDAPRNDLSWGQRLARAGINGVEGLTIGQISTGVATKASQGVLGPSAGLAVETGQLWIVPVAVIATWTVSYAVTNMALSYVADRINEATMPDLGY